MSDFNLEAEKALEEVSVKNIKAVVEYSRQTRDLVRSLERQVNESKDMIIQQNSLIEQLRAQIVHLLIKTENLR